MEYQLKNCTEKQLPEILSIFNDAILNSTALYEYKMRTIDTMHIWYENKHNANYPVIGIFDIDESLMGFATYGQFRVQPAYKYTIEHSVYIRFDKRGMGLGKILLKSIITKAKEQNYHTMVGVIDTTNIHSIKLHENEGFALSGIMKQVGFKFGKWLDTAFYQLVLNTPKCPKDDK